ncbi:MAG TPA: TGS domain-containing protein [Anaerolineae bacterium]|nr:bifunctional (p)ppGpp synthetase/guanosine-3',5'-bis(diphosphate) 3'-pyrophosphohydrolase [Anaerolineae bacterium]MCB0178670.1 bifunctional (p)ppGpp synthetase/guanosine-3',5'-bis(diphosphate) 3'-pyrophosphohydrolase [Anaerolineae bacterium]MCB0222612.1 bifunctional (p)ppGpp synthetase/guanosine-3',5'-bis(diphosphate) 3'-pyrophosphohydrolase [Anaerolineae bacterium]HRV94536.1 TGS domain-containing protein [Anaerolineae bacterium]
MPTQSNIPPVVVQARQLAESVAATQANTLSATSSAPETFMSHRPNTLAESYQHGLAVAQILAKWNAEPDLQAAGLLHSLIFKGVLSTEAVSSACDKRTAFLCEQYCDILKQSPETQRHGKPGVLRRIKLFIAAYCDPALAFLGVASLWDHFILARQSEPAFQRLFATEVQEVMLPLLDMLGISVLKTEVETWVLQQGKHRQDYHYLTKRLAQTQELRLQTFEHVRQKLISHLPGANLSYKSQTPSQIYDPQFSEKAHPETLQRLLVDILVDTEAECYTALRWIHRLWQPVEYSLVDHIGVSQTSGERSLQTTVTVLLNSQSLRTVFNIRTHEMEQINRWGLAALQMRDHRQADLPRAWWSHRDESFAKICSAPMGALPETMYVFSPQGELFRFHRGCSVVDYAYQVHSEVAHQCKRFKINGEVVGPATILHHLDLVELERDPQFPGPNQTWLNAARTSRARSNIERILKRQARNQNEGRAVLNHQLRELSEHYRIDIPEHRIEQVLQQAARHLNFEQVEDLLAAIAAGRVSSEPILHPIFATEIVRQVETPESIRLFPHQLSLAQCCKPRPGDEIIGRPRYRDQEVIHLKIHQANCNYITKRNLAGEIPLRWRLQPQLKAVARLEMTALAKDTLLYDVMKLFRKNMPNITIHKVDAIARSGMVRVNLTVEAKDQSLIDKISQDLKVLPGHTISEVRQMKLLLSEREELVKPASLSGFNPYRRQPVKDREMFFGRSAELDTVSNLLRAGTGVIVVQGQRRVGKTSLLLHLKKYYLNRFGVLPVFIDFQLFGRLSDATFYYEIANAVYNDLQDESQAGDLEPPLRELFEWSPPAELIKYLKNVQRHFGLNKLVLLIDEFSRTIDAYQQQRLDRTFFEQWRGVIQATIPEVSYIMVIQQQSYNQLQSLDDQTTVAPIWHLLELGEPMTLKPLDEKAARQLIERPTYNILEYSPEAIRQVWRLAGGSPFLIQAFCFNLVRFMAYKGDRHVTLADIELVQAEFMRPNESLFAHLLDIIQIEKAALICRHLVRLTNGQDQVVSPAELTEVLPNVSKKRMLSTLKQLTHQHILIEPEPKTWMFASLLFSRWLAVNRILE